MSAQPLCEPLLNEAVMDFLKEATRVAHRAAEAVPYNRALLEETLPRPAYVAQLHAYRVVYTALVEAGEQTSCPRVQKIWAPDDKVARLNQDLDHLDPQTRFISLEAMAVAQHFGQEITAQAKSEPLTLLGTLYVLEGASLGGLVMSRPLQRAFGLGTEGLSFFGAHPHQTVLRFKALREAMNALTFSEAERQVLLASALSTFAGIEQILWALSDDFCIHGSTG